MNPSLRQIIRWTLGGLSALLIAAALIGEGWVIGAAEPAGTNLPRTEAIRTAVVHAPLVAPMLVQLQAVLGRR